MVIIEVFRLFYKNITHLCIKNMDGEGMTFTSYFSLKNPTVGATITKLDEK